MARIPLVVVDAVQNARHGAAPGAGAQAVLQPHAVLIGADLACMGRADRGDGVGVQDAVAQGVDPPGGEIVLVQQVAPARQPEIGNPGRREDALIADVVDRQHRAGRGEQRLVLPHRLEEQRRKGGVPVVAMQNLRRPGEALAGGQRRAREPEEAQVLVGIAGVEGGARIQRGAVDQVRRRAARQLRAQHREHVVVGSHRQRHLLQALDRLRGIRRAVDGGVARRKQPHVMTGAVQVLGQRPAHVPQSAGLGERFDFGGEQADGEFLWHVAVISANACQVMMQPCGVC